MVGALDQFSFPVHSFRFAHFIGAGFQFVYKFVYLRQTADFICGHRISESCQPRLDIVKVGNGFKQRPTRQIGQHFLKFAKGEACPVSQFGIYFVVAFAVFNEIHHSPEIAVGILVKKFSIGCGNECQHLAVDVFHSGVHQFLTNVHGYAQNIALQLRHVFKNGMVNALKHILFFSGFHLVRIVDVSCSQRFYIDFFSITDKSGDDFL